MNPVIFLAVLQGIACIHIALALQAINSSEISEVYSSICCDLEGSDRLIDCLRSYRQKNLATSIPALRHNKSIVTLVAYDTENILEYALYSLAINSVYAQANGYNQFLASQVHGFDFEPKDQRWNKVKILELLVESSLAAGDESHLLVWMDSDLVVLDWRLRLQDVAAAHPAADLLVSQDVDPLNGMVNTGCMIVRCTQWSLAFLRQWWDTVSDKADGMDQHVFDRVYQHRLQQSDCLYCNNKTGTTANDSRCATCVATKIAILPPYALNSQVPASQHQQATHRVLHLAGEAGAVRRHVFAKGYREVCRALGAVRTLYSERESKHWTPEERCAGLRALASAGEDSANGDSGISQLVQAAVRSQQSVPGIATAAVGSALGAVRALLPPQLGITREFLQGLNYAALLRASLEVVLQDLQRCGIGGSAGSACDLARVEKLRAEMRDVMQSRDDAALQQALTTSGADSSNSAFAALQERHLQGLRWALAAHQQVCAGPASNSSSPIHGTGAVAAPAQVRLACVQGLIDAAFELYVSAPDTHTRETALGATAPAVSSLVTALAGTASHGPALFYQFKYLDFRADYHEQLSQRGLELGFLTQALAVWQQMEGLGHFGAGNKVSDRHKEAAGILARMARIECADDVELTDTRVNVSGDRSDDQISDFALGSEAARVVGLRHIQQSLNYTASAWLAPELSAYVAGAAEVDVHTAARKFSVTALSGVAGRVLLLLAEGCYTALLCLRPKIAAATKEKGNRGMATLAEDSADDRQGSKELSEGYAACEKKTRLHSLYVQVATQLCRVLRARGEGCSAVLLAEVAALQRSFRCITTSPVSHTQDASRQMPAAPQLAQPAQQQKVYKRLKRKQRPPQ